MQVDTGLWRYLAYLCYKARSTCRSAHMYVYILYNAFMLCMHMHVVYYVCISMVHTLLLLFLFKSAEAANTRSFAL